MSGLRLVFVGLSLSSSWGNGHATTYRSLLKGLHALGHDALFLEQDVPWYASHRDLLDPPFARLALYADPEDLRRRFADAVAEADAVIVGSYVQEGPAVLDWARETARGTVAFYDIDTPVTLARLGREGHYIEPRQIPSLDLYLSFTGGPTLGRIEREHGAPLARALFCSVDTDVYRPDPAAPRRWRLGYLGTYSDDRQPALERLLLEPARRRGGDAFAVAGPQYPDTVAWPPNVERIEHLAPDRHPAFYAAQGFTLNVTRADMVAAGWSPSVRLFEAAACGAPILSDRWNGLGDVFPLGEAILVADTAEEAAAALDLPEPRRRALAEAAREVALARHSSEARAADLVAALEEARARRATPAPRRAATP